MTETIANDAEDRHPIGSREPAHAIHDPDDISDALQHLARLQQPLALYPAAAHMPLTAYLMPLRPDASTLVLRLEPDSRLPPGDCIFVARLGAAKLQFRLSAPEWLSLPDRPGLLPIPFPTQCLVQNRRAAPRLAAPLGAGYTAFFVLDGWPRELQLSDFSLGGIGMRCPPQEAGGLYIGRRLRRVQLDLHRETPVICDLEIRLARPFHSALLGDQVQIGCQFVTVTPQTRDDIARIADSLAPG